ncbi:uncharacterized protein TrAtP1_009914 [Trichoderma atroviride]|uniref:Glycine-rich cell wall structural protein 1 n=1 Tax=Hypocrea atroviridis (strain ATCC 20476 / IMI 206040) TaxID=452589 RepID=G9NED4_HYPAI|nr:uncharacterized protein TRIATDRAFT_94244 [Trichoderma atroviride IMI 206040]EHK51040.1 hypothetical protein TRIATDRAFT_94244 [Trichoderma atroviride IMI 206040]UKZ68896.1 hypothetical protein TrAtP1_009914 [Trichoderma atroviride]
MASALETLNNLASSAAKAVWGESNDAETHKEPISGATGDVSKGEPYDAGNLDPQAQSKVESSLKGEEAAPSDLDDQNYTLSSSKKDEGVLSAAATSATNEGVSEPRSAPTTGTANPEEGKPLDELTGKGPRPVEELAKENDGNAAAAAAAPVATETDSSTAVSALTPEEKKPELSGTEQKSNTHEATEDEYVKSSGLAADGGDFDVTKPGAGLEADRLMEQKGIKVDDAEPKDKNSSSSSNGGRKSSDSSRKDKPKLKERIKTKLHMH